MIVDQRVDHARRARRIIGRVAIDQHVDVGIDIGEHAPHHMALALAALAAHLGAGRARHLDGAIRRIVVVDEDLGRRQRLAKIGDHGRDRGFLVEARHQNRNPQRWCRHRRLSRIKSVHGRLYRNQALAGCGKAGLSAARSPRRSSVANSRVQSESMAIGIDIIWREDRMGHEEDQIDREIQRRPGARPAWRRPDRSATARRSSTTAITSKVNCTSMR